MVEILKTNQIKKRSGNTEITSVSLTKEFKEYITNLKISPTEALRKGIAIECYERNIPQFLNDTNKKREEIVKELTKQNKFNEFLKKLQEFNQSVKDLDVSIDKFKLAQFNLTKYSSEILELLGQI